MELPEKYYNRNSDRKYQLSKKTNNKVYTSHFKKKQNAIFLRFYSFSLKSMERV